MLGKRNAIGNDERGASPEARRRAAWITPVPGGVGPMAGATLPENAVNISFLAAAQPRGVPRTLRRYRAHLYASSTLST